MTVAVTSHFAQIARNASIFAGVTTAHMRSCDSLMRISSGVSVGSRSGTGSSSTCMPPSPLAASSVVAQESPARAEVLDALDQLGVKQLQACTR